MFVNKAQYDCEIVIKINLVLMWNLNKCFNSLIVYYSVKYLDFSWIQICIKYAFTLRVNN